MALAIGHQPGFVDLQPAQFAAGSVVSDLLLTRIQDNAAYGCLSIECFQGVAYANDTIAAPISFIDGYAYQPAEIFVLGTYADSHAGVGPTPPGQLLVLSQEISDTYKVGSLVAYYVQGGQQTNTNDGQLQIWVVAVRNWGGLTLASTPAFTDVANSALAQDQPFTQATAQALSENARLSAIRCEFFFNLAVPITTVSRTSNVVTVNTAFPHNLSVGDPITVLFVEDASFNTRFASGNSIVKPVQESAPIGSTVASVVSPTSLTILQVGPNLTSAGGRIQKGYFKNGDTYPAPKSFYDGYQYSYSELHFVPFLIYSGNPAGSGPSGPGRIRRLGPFTVNATNGLVGSSVTYWDGSTQTATNDGRLGVACFAMRSISGSPPMAQAQTTYVDLDASNFFFGSFPDSGNLTKISRNAKFAIGRPEWFTITPLGGGASIPVPTSPLDNSTYARNQLAYLSTLQDSGDAGTGCITYFQQSVDPSSGLVTLTVPGSTTGLVSGMTVASRG